jgi:predicted nucleic acid-binding protein
MLIYFDTCCLQRPLDDRSNPRNNVEAEAILTILGIVERHNVTLVYSELLDFELSKIPDEDRKNKAFEILGISSEYLMLTDEIEQKAKEYMKNNIKPMDALHLASAVVNNIHYFCTTDDKFLKKAKTVDTSRTKSLSPLELISEVLK